MLKYKMQGIKKQKKKNTTNMFITILLFIWPPVYFISQFNAMECFVSNVSKPKSLPVYFTNPPLPLNVNPEIHPS